MPTKTALVITIGDVIESRPPRRKRFSTHKRPDSSSSSTSSEHEVRVRRVSRQNSETMKTRTLATSTTTVNGNDKFLSNGVCNGLRRGRLMSADQVLGSLGPLSPRTRSGIKQEIDDEVTFGDPVSLDGMGDKNANGQTAIGSPGSKKKRRSFHEKFLEDNSDYYGFQVLPSKLRSSEGASSDSYFDNSVWDFLQTGKEFPGVEKRNRQKSGDPPEGVNGSDSESNLTGRRGSNNSDKKQLKVNLDKLKAEEKRSGHSSDDEEENSSVSGKSSRKGSAMSPSSKKRRSELDKLLEAGSSSFHFETARETASRLNGGESLGPIHVDVEDEKPSRASSEEEEVADEDEVDDEADAASESDDHEEEPPKRNGSTRKAAGPKASKRLLQQADASTKKRGTGWGTNKNGHQPNSVAPVKKHFGRPPKGSKKMSKELSAALEQELERKLMLEKYLPLDMFEKLECSLSELDGSEVNVDLMEFSFEKTPFRESWFTTYSRQDQGEEILYYPEPKSFQLPYEMPVSTFYPKKDGPGGRIVESRRGTKRKIFDSENPSAIASLAASGTATPIEEEPEVSRAASEDDPWARAPPSPPKPVTRGKRGGGQQHAQVPRQPRAFEAIGELSNSSSSSFLSKLGPKAAAALREYSRKSPRGHASTRSLFSTPGETVDQTDDSEADGEGHHLDVESVPHLIDECSNDSAISHFSHFSNTDQTVQDLDPTLIDEFLRQSDPDLAAGGDESLCASPVPPTTSTANDSDTRPSSGESPGRKKLKRRSSDRRHHHKHHRRPKDANGVVPADDPMDRLVAANVDEVLLDCLEEELPSVPIDGELPGSEPLELLDNYSGCDSMLICSSRKPRPRPFLRTPSTSSNSTLDTKEKQKLPSRLYESPRKAVLKKLTNSPSRVLKTGPPAFSQPKTIVEDDSSSEYTSACETLSIASTVNESSSLVAVRKSKKRRNATGFQSPAKKKSPGGGKSTVPAVPKVTLKVPSKILAGRQRQLAKGQGGKRLKKSVSPLKKRRLLPARKPMAKAVRSPTNRSIQLRQSKSFHDDDEEVVDEDPDSDSHEVFQLKSSKKLKLIVRKKTGASRRGATVIKIRRPLRVPIRRKLIEDSGSSDEDENDVVNNSEGESCEEEDDEPLRESLRLKTKKKGSGKKKRRKNKNKINP